MTPFGRHHIYILAAGVLYTQFYEVLYMSYDRVLRYYITERCGVPDIPASIYHISASLYLIAHNFPENGTISELAEGPAQAHNTYGIQWPLMFPHLHRLQCSHPICCATQRPQRSRPAPAGVRVGQKVYPPLSSTRSQH
jgi:hypothetical protein